MLLLREAFYGATRFDEFVSRAEISEPAAAAKLRELTELGILRREPYREPGQRTRHAYHLTDMGRDLLPAVVALFAWGDRWLLDAGARVELTHADCGAPVSAVLACRHGHEVPGEELALRVRRRMPRA
jgi:DNA-binding HxlR family transcriptional regulator